MPRRKRGGDLASSAAKRRKQKEYRRNETEEEREARLQNQRTRMSTLRSGKSEERKENKTIEESRILKDNLTKEAFHYESTKKYYNHKYVVIGKMNNICQFCHAKKFSKETPGLCCIVSSPSRELKTEPDLGRDNTSIHEEFIIKTEIDPHPVEISETFGDNHVSNEFPAPSTSTDNINAGNGVSQAKKSSWLESEVNTLKTYPKATKRATKAPDKDQEVIVRTTDLCVLCAKDISKLRIRQLLDVNTEINLIFILTGINILGYSIPPYACSACYKALESVKAIQYQFQEGSELLKKKLDCFNKHQIEFASVPTHDQENVQIKIETPDIDMEEMRVENNTVIEENTTARWDSDDILNNQAVPDKFKTSFPHTKCGVCGKLYKDKASHECQVVPTVKEVKLITSDNNMQLGKLCRICGEYYMKSYKSHAKTHATAIKKCNICEKDVIISSFKYHMMAHGRNKREKFVCFVCGKVYAKISSLRKHEVIHADKQFWCNICGLKFHYGVYLRRHLRTHTGDKPHACSFCNKRFSLLWNKRQHERLHTNDRPYKCQLCSKAFRHNVSLKSHIVSFHSASEIATLTNVDMSEQPTTNDCQSEKLIEVIKLESSTSGNKSDDDKSISITTVTAESDVS